MTVEETLSVKPTSKVGASQKCFSYSAKIIWKCSGPNLSEHLFLREAYNRVVILEYDYAMNIY